MNKYIVMYVIPGMILLPTIWWLVRQWYLKVYKFNVKRSKELDKATATYERQLGITQKQTKRKKK